MERNRRFNIYHYSRVTVAKLAPFICLILAATGWTRQEFQAGSQYPVEQSGEESDGEGYYDGTLHTSRTPLHSSKPSLSVVPLYVQVVVRDAVAHWV